MNGPAELQKPNYYTYITTSSSGLSFHKWADFSYGKQVNMLFFFFLLLLQTLSQRPSYSRRGFFLMQSKVFLKCNFNITNVEFNVSTSLLPTYKNRRISLLPRLVVLSWATRFEIHTNPSSPSLTTQRTVVTKHDFFSSPSPIIQNILFFP